MQKHPGEHTMIGYFCGANLDFVRFDTLVWWILLRFREMTDCPVFGGLI